MTKSVKEAKKHTAVKEMLQDFKQHFKPSIKCGWPLNFTVYASQLYAKAGISFYTTKKVLEQHGYRVYFCRKRDMVLIRKQVRK